MRRSTLLLGIFITLTLLVTFTAGFQNQGVDELEAKVLAKERSNHEKRMVGPYIAIGALVPVSLDILVCHI